MNLLSGIYTRTEKYESDFYVRIDLLNEPEKVLYLYMTYKFKNYKYIMYIGFYDNTEYKLKFDYLIYTFRDNFTGDNIIISRLSNIKAQYNSKIIDFGNECELTIEKYNNIIFAIEYYGICNDLILGMRISINIKFDLYGNIIKFRYSAYDDYEYVSVHYIIKYLKKINYKFPDSVYSYTVNDFIKVLTNE
jgi:hypothetical protein